jgi:hypothetical protein
MYIYIYTLGYILEVKFGFYPSKRYQLRQALTQYTGYHNTYTHSIYIYICICTYACTSHCHHTHQRKIHCHNTCTQQSQYAKTYTQQSHHPNNTHTHTHMQQPKSASALSNSRHLSAQNAPKQADSDPEKYRSALRAWLSPKAVVFGTCCSPLCAAQLQIKRREMHRIRKKLAP